MNLQETRLLAKLYPPFAQKIRELLTAARNAKLDVILHSTFRSVSEQQAIFNKRDGSSMARGGFSWHNYGLAADVVFNDGNGGPSWGAKNPWQQLGEIGESLGLEWGGRWKRIKDLGHFQFTYGLTIKEASRALSAGGLPKVWSLVIQKEAEYGKRETGAMRGTGDERNGDSVVETVAHRRRRRR
jgi:hypothetical protein